METDEVFLPVTVRDEPNQKQVALLKDLDVRLHGKPTPGWEERVKDMTQAEANYMMGFLRRTINATRRGFTRGDEIRIFE